MEALHAAIANYRGEPNPFESDEDHEGRLICRCFGVTDVKVLKVARENQLRNAEEVTQYCKAGGACGSCLDDIQRILDDMWKFDQALKK
jgi:NifU-like protein